MIEQPGVSLMEYYEKMTWLYNRIPAASAAFSKWCLCVYESKLRMSSIADLVESRSSRLLGGWARTGHRVRNDTRPSATTHGLRNITLES